MEGIVAIELQPQQAQFFALCNTHFATINFMFLSNVFDIREGNATLHFGKTGKLLKIDRHLFTVAPF